MVFMVLATAEQSSPAELLTVLFPEPQVLDTQRQVCKSARACERCSLPTPRYI